MKKYLKFEFLGMIFCAILSVCCLGALLYGIFIEKSIVICIIFLLNSIAMLFNSLAYYISWKTSIQFDNYFELEKKILEKNISSKIKEEILLGFKSISNVELDPFANTHIENDPTYSNQGGQINNWRFKDNENNITYTDEEDNLTRFKNLIIPKGITFVKHKYVESLVGDKRTPCDVLTNGGIDIDPLEGVNHKNKNCFGINCCDCIFFDQNANQRAEYFKQLQKEKEKNE